jgi:ABC-type uncharacterized transport system auxiliary subunit
MALAAVVLFGGCLTPRNYAERTNYILRPQPNVPKAEATEKTVGVRPLAPAESVRDEIAYREQAYELSYYGSARWAEAPRDVVTRTLKDALIASGHFGDVGDARDVQPTLLLIGELREFEEVRDAEGRFAVVTVRLEARYTADDKAAWTGTLTSRIPVEGDGLSALAAAMSRAVAEIAEQAAAGIVKNT